MSIEVEVRIPSTERQKWTPAHAADAVGKPVFDRIGDDGEIGTVVAAEVVDGELILKLDVEGAGSTFPLDDGERLSIGIACSSCLDSGHVCENHPERPWAGMVDGGCNCGGAGMPCPACCSPITEDGSLSSAEAFVPDRLR